MSFKHTVVPSSKGMLPSNGKEQSIITHDMDMDESQMWYVE